MKLHYFQHVPFETPGYILDWAKGKGAEIGATRFFEDGYTLPAIEAVDFLVVMGGPMGVYDTQEYPWLVQEADFIRAFVESGKPAIGICLGSQFIANALGAKVYKGTKEIGWMPVRKVKSGRFFTSFPEEQVVMHWHGDTFDLPDGATLLASNDVTRHQAFEYKNCLGLQFHFEMGPENINEILRHAANDLSDDPYVQTSEEIRQEERYFAQNRAILFDILDQLSKAGISA